MIKLYRIILCVAGIFVLVALSGCAAPADYKLMMVKPTNIEQQNSRLTRMITMGNVAGGKETYAMWIPEINNDGIKKALEGSLNAHGYLANSSGAAKYQLDTYLQELNRPFIGLDVEAESVIVYRIYGSGVDKKYKISALGKARVADTFIGKKRVKIANERSIQENIKEFLKKLRSF